MPKNDDAVKLLSWLADGCRAGILALTDLSIVYASRRGGPCRVGFTVESIPGRKGTSDETQLDDLELFAERFRSGFRRAVLSDRIPPRGLGPSEKRTFWVTYA
jgi:hypothetical protein